MKPASKRLRINATTLRVLCGDELQMACGADPGMSDRSCWEICITRIATQCTTVVYTKNCPVPQGGQV